MGLGSQILPHELLELFGPSNHQGFEPQGSKYPDPSQLILPSLLTFFLQLYKYNPSLRKKDKPIWNPRVPERRELQNNPFYLLDSSS